MFNIFFIFTNILSLCTFENLNRKTKSLIFILVQILDLVVRIILFYIGTNSVLKFLYKLIRYWITSRSKVAGFAYFHWVKDSFHVFIFKVFLSSSKNSILDHIVIYLFKNCEVFVSMFSYKSYLYEFVKFHDINSVIISDYSRNEFILLSI